MGWLHNVLCGSTWRSLCDYCTSSPGWLEFTLLINVQQPIQLIICLGPLYGVGAGMLFAPTINYMSEWFDKKKSLAYGIMYVERPLPFIQLLTISKLWNGWSFWSDSTSDLHSVPRKVRLQSDYHRMGHLCHHLYGCRCHVCPFEAPLLLAGQTIDLRFRFPPQAIVLDPVHCHRDPRPRSLRS
jgi:hypothetical protein